MPDQAVGPGDQVIVRGSAHAAVSCNPHTLLRGARIRAWLRHPDPTSHPTKPLRDHPKTTPRNRCAISQGRRIAARFRKDPFSSGVALPQLLVVRLAKRCPTAARHNQG